MGDRVKRRLGDACGLTRFGVNLVTLGPGGQSALRHWHTLEDEFVYVLEGTVVVVTDAGEQELRAGDCAGYPAGTGDGHHLINRSAADVVYLEIGDRMAGDEAGYPDVDLELRAEGERMMVGMASDMKARVEEAIKNAQVNQSRFLGVMAEDPTACYSAIVQRLKSETGKDVTIVGLFAAVYLKGKPVYYYLYSPYRSAQTATVLLAKHRQNVATLLAANKQ